MITLDAFLLLYMLCILICCSSSSGWINRTSWLCLQLGTRYMPELRLVKIFVLNNCLSTPWLHVFFLCECMRKRRDEILFLARPRPKNVWATQSLVKTMYQDDMAHRWTGTYKVPCIIQMDLWYTKLVLKHWRTYMRKIVEVLYSCISILEPFTCWHEWHLRIKVHWWTININELYILSLGDYLLVSLILTVKCVFSLFDW